MNMGIEQNLRNLQDNLRNQGWRIQWIPWQEPGKPEYFYNTKLTGFLGFVCLGCFLGGIVWMYQFRQLLGLVVALAGLALGILSSFYASWQQRRNWVKVEATLLDVEIQKGYLSRSTQRPGVQMVYESRILCRFEYEGQTYTVTPEVNPVFRTFEAAEEYLLNQPCTLWIDPKNPLHTTFSKKPKVASLKPFR
jgi:hypothetical protein